MSSPEIIHDGFVDVLDDERLASDLIASDQAHPNDNAPGAGSFFAGDGNGQ